MKQDYEFVKTHNVDKEKFAQLLLLAKGGQTLRHFADLCGTTSSTFTRILQKVNKGASTPELLMAIAENAVPESNVTIEDLADTNGYTIKKTQDPIYQTKTNAKSVIYDYLVENNDSVTIENYKFPVGDCIVQPDVFAKTVSFDGVVNQLFIDIFSSYSLDLQKCIIEKIGRYMLLSEIHQDKLRSAQYTIIVFEKDAFDKTKKILDACALSFVVFVLYADCASGQIVDEYTLGQKTEY